MFVTMRPSKWNNAFLIFNWITFLILFWVPVLLNSMKLVFSRVLKHILLLHFPALYLLCVFGGLEAIFFFSWINPFLCSLFCWAWVCQVSLSSVQNFPGSMAVLVSAFNAAWHSMLKWETASNTPSSKMSGARLLVLGPKSSHLKLHFDFGSSHPDIWSVEHPHQASGKLVSVQQLFQQAAQYLVWTTLSCLQCLYWSDNTSCPLPQGNNVNVNVNFVPLMVQNASGWHKLPFLFLTGCQHCS